MSAVPRTPLVPVRKLPECPWCGCKKWITQCNVLGSGRVVCYDCEYELNVGDLVNGTFKVITPDEFYKNLFVGEQ